MPNTNRITVRINDSDGRFLTLVDLWDARGSIMIEAGSGIVIGTYYEGMNLVMGQHLAIGHAMGTVTVTPSGRAL